MNLQGCRRLGIICVLVLTIGQEAAATPPTEDKPARLGTAARDVFTRNCVECHGGPGKIQRGLDLTNPEKLPPPVLVPGNPAKSRIFKRIMAEDDEYRMPPASWEGKKYPRLPKRELNIIEEWIKAGGPSWRDQEARRFISNREILAAVLADLDSATEIEATRYRYFSFTHLYNAGEGKEEIELARIALLKLLHFLTWQAQPISVVPVSPDTLQGTVFRVSLSDLGWSSEVWGRIGALDPFALELNLPSASACYQRTGCLIPIIRGDWFIHDACRPPLYYEILGIPKTLKNLEKQLGIDSEANIENARVWRFMPKTSSVSVSNRLGEGHPGRFPYYRTYDNPNSKGKANFRDHPLDFVAAGGEVIFGLPNGCHGYLLVDGKGNRIDEGPIQIVSDQSARPPVVIAGFSCLKCHERGLIGVQDVLLPHVMRNLASFTREEVLKVQALHPEQHKLDLIFQRDNQGFLSALKAAEIPLTKTEPITTVSDLFDRELTRTRVSAEVGVAPEQLDIAIERNPNLKRPLGDIRNPGGIIMRDSFLEVFPELAQEVHQGVVVFAARRQGGAVFRYQVQATCGSRVYRWTEEHCLIERSASYAVFTSQRLLPHSAGKTPPEQLRVPHAYDGAVVAVDLSTTTVRAYKTTVRDGEVVRTFYSSPFHGLVRWEEKRADRQVTGVLVSVTVPGR